MKIENLMNPQNELMDILSPRLPRSFRTNKFCEEV